MPCCFPSVLRSNPCSLSVLWSHVVSKNIHTVNGELCCHQEHNNHGLLSSSVPHLLVMKVWQISVKEGKILWETWYSLLALIGKTGENRSCLGHKLFFCSCSKVLGKCTNQPWKPGFLQAQIFWKYSVTPQSRLCTTLYFNLRRLSILCLSNISQWISKEIVNLQWQGQGVTVQDGFFPCKWAGTSLLTAKEYFLLAQPCKPLVCQRTETNTDFFYSIVKCVLSLSSAEVKFSFRLCLYWIGTNRSWPQSEHQGDYSMEVVYASAGEVIQRVYQFGTVLMWLGFCRKPSRFGCLWNVEEDRADHV